jgi:hypothetical protein
MDILIVIFWVTANQLQRAARCDLKTGRRQPDAANFEMTVCKNLLQPDKEKAAQRTLIRSTAFILEDKTSITRRFWSSELYDHGRNRLARCGDAGAFHQWLARYPAAEQPGNRANGACRASMGTSYSAELP